MSLNVSTPNHNSGTPVHVTFRKYVLPFCLVFLYFFKKETDLFIKYISNNNKETKLDVHEGYTKSNNLKNQ